MKYKQSKYKLYHNDCLEQMKQLHEEGVKVDLVLTDPPYGVTDSRWDSIVPFDKMWETILPLCNDTTPILLFGCEPFSSKLRLSNIKEYHYDWIWNKQRASNVFNRKIQPLPDYEVISVFYRKYGQYYPLMKKTKPRSFKRKSHYGSNVYSGVKTDRDYVDDGARYPQRIITFNSCAGECNNTKRLHPSQKPVALLEYLIKTYTQSGDTVLDFTMGSGSTGVACMNTGRDFIGIEEKYYKIAEKRISDANKQTKLIPVEDN